MAKVVSLIDAAFFLLSVPEITCSITGKSYNFLSYKKNFKSSNLSSEEKSAAIDYFMAWYVYLGEQKTRELFDRHPYMYSVCSTMSFYGPLDPYFLKLAENCLKETTEC